MKLFFLIFLMGGFSGAATLLVPGAQTEFEYYRKHCRRGDYICSADYFTSVLSRKPTPDFDREMDNLDLGDRSSSDSFRNRLVHILNTEEISMQQLKMLLEVLRDMNRLQPSVYFKIIETELRRLSAEIESAGPAREEAFIFIFKTRFPLAKFQRLRTMILKIPVYLLHYSSLPQKSNSRELAFEKKVSLLPGDCGLTMSRPVSRLAWAALLPPACGESRAKAKADFENKPAAHVRREFQ